MKKFIVALLLALSLFLAPMAPLRAQQGQFPVQLTMGTTVTCDTDYGQHYFYLKVSGGNVTTFQFSSTAPQQAEDVTVVFQQDSNGSRTVGLASNIYGTLNIDSTANSFSYAKFSYDVVSQSWYITASVEQ